MEGKQGSAFLLECRQPSKQNSLCMEDHREDMRAPVLPAAGKALPSPPLHTAEGMCLCGENKNRLQCILRLVILASYFLFFFPSGNRFPNRVPPSSIRGLLPVFIFSRKSLVFTQCDSHQVGLSESALLSSPERVRYVTQGRALTGSHPKL